MDTIQTLEQLKSAERFFHAGSYAFITGRDENYGCHFGMRSTYQRAVYEFRAGWREAANAYNFSNGLPVPSIVQRVEAKL